MYIPKLNLTTDRQEIIAFMRRFNFATIVTAGDQIPKATHLPFVIAEREEQIILTSHFAKANPQHLEMGKYPILVIFNEPHAYISPTFYDQKQNVPTWNYLSVHAYGQGNLLSDDQQAFAALEEMITTFESSYKTQWDSLPSEYKRAMVNGIVAFEIIVTDLQGKKKLSQNKTTQVQQRIVNSFSQSSDTNKQVIAKYMQDNLYPK